MVSQLGQGILIVFVRAAGPKQSHEGKERLLRGVYPERSRRARNDRQENPKAQLGQRGNLVVEPPHLYNCGT